MCEICFACARVLACAPCGVKGQNPNPAEGQRRVERTALISSSSIFRPRCSRSSLELASIMHAARGWG